MNHIPFNNASSGGASGERGEPSGEPLDAMVDAYVDGRMSVAERAAFEARLTREPALRAEVAAHQQLEAMLREQYAESPAAGQAIASAGQGDSSGRGGTRRIGRWWLGAAAAIAVAVALWQWGLLTPSRQPRVGDKLVAEYAAQVAGGFVPKEVCTTNEAFVEWTMTAYGIGISPAALPASVQLLGWTKRDTLSSYTGVLLARVDGQEVIVFMDPSGLEASEASRSGQNLRVFTQRIGGLTLYEVTPSDRPAVLPGLKQVEVSR